MEFSKARQLTPSNGKHHFFGYFGISPWDSTGRYFVCLESAFQDHLPKFGEKAGILLLDLEQGTSKIIAETQGWNFQQGTMLHWLPGSPTKIIFNDCDETHAFSRVLDVITGEGYELPRPINGVAHTKDIGVCVNFTRLRRNRKVVSLPSADDYSRGGVHPDDDGIWIMDLHTGELELILTLDEVWQASDHLKMLDEEIFKELKKEFWFNHLAFNETDTRIHFLGRYSNLFAGLVTSMWTCNTDGSDLYLVVDFGHQLSHFEWVDDQDLIVTMNWPNKKHKSHVRITDKVGNWRTIAEDTLTRDGHPPVSPDKQLMATDTYIVDGRRYVYIVELESEEVHEVFSFDNPPKFDREIRCDPHPRWRPDGTQLSFDALGENGRQVYVIDVNK